ncbi:MAG: Uma2 family endonuclease [Clostridia bacterium]|nr:Uma2 family endonuclease [Clostridia bacterium]
MRLEEMKWLRKERGMSYEMIAQRSGVSLGTVKKIFGGYVQTPRYQTLAALEEAFKPDIRDYAIPAFVEETAFDYSAKKQGEYTIEDVEKIPEEIRVELIDGKMYYLAAPTHVHQKIALKLTTALSNYIETNGGDCEAGIAPTDFKLLPDSDKTMVQPDVFVVCDTNKMGDKRMTGAPDLAIEILSPSNSVGHMELKMKKYRESGVREYWRVDYDNGNIYVYQFGQAFQKQNNQGDLVKDGIFISIYDVRDRIPVGIFPGLEIDFAEIDDDVQKYIAKCGGKE